MNPIRIQDEENFGRLRRGRLETTSTGVGRGSIYRTKADHDQFCPRVIFQVRQAGHPAPIEELLEGRHVKSSREHAHSSGLTVAGSEKHFANLQTYPHEAHVQVCEYLTQLLAWCELSRTYSGSLKIFNAFPQICLDFRDSDLLDLDPAVEG
jgi:hypothetical protein